METALLSQRVVFAHYPSGTHTRTIRWRLPHPLA